MKHVSSCRNSRELISATCRRAAAGTCAAGRGYQGCAACCPTRRRLKGIGEQKREGVKRCRNAGRLCHVSAAVAVFELRGGLMGECCGREMSHELLVAAREWSHANSAPGLWACAGGRGPDCPCACVCECECVNVDGMGSRLDGKEVCCRLKELNFSLAMQNPAHNLPNGAAEY